MMDDEQLRGVLADKNKFLTNLDRVARVLMTPGNRPFVFGAIEAQLNALAQTQEWKTFHLPIKEKKELPEFLFIGNGLFLFGLRNVAKVEDQAVTKKFSELRLENYAEGPVHDGVKAKHALLSSKEDLIARLEAFEKDYGTFKVMGAQPNENEKRFYGLRIVLIPNKPYANDFGFFTGLASTDDPHVRRHAELPQRHDPTAPISITQLTK